MSSPKKYRFYELDMLRFLAAMAVVVYHYTFRGNAADDLSVVAYPELSDISRYGFLGVDLFFMISGFVILLTASNRNASGFVISRLVRLYPAFWACVTFSAVFIALFGGDRFNVFFGQYLLNLTMISEQFGVKQIDGVYWTLLVELKFYLLIFLVLVANQIKRINAIIGVWLLVTCVVTFVDTPYFVRMLLFPEWAYYFIAGAMFYQVRQEGPGIYKLLIIAVTYMLALHGVEERLLALHEHYGADFSAPLVLATITAFYAIFALVALEKTAFANHPILLKCGALTYPLYLVHQNMGYIVINQFSESMNRYLLLAVTITLALVVSYLVNVLVEQRFSRPFRDFLTRQKDNLLPSLTR